MSSPFIYIASEAVAAIVLLVMLVQDWRWRGIHWPLFPILAVLLFISHLRESTPTIVLTDFFINSLLLGLQVLLLTLYVRLRFRTSLFHYLGMGDILYWLACALYFSPALFLAYHITSLLAALGGHFLFSRAYSEAAPARIPLAGFQAACLLLLLLLFWTVPPYRQFNDEALLAFCW